MKQYKTININSKKEITVLEALRLEGMEVIGDCGGLGTCGKCKVILSGTDSMVTPMENAIFNAEELAEGWRLACYARICGQGQVRLPAVTGNENGYLSCQLPVEYLAIDLGSTSIALAQVDSVGQLIKNAVIDNPQRLYGSDVLTRLSFALRKGDNRQLLRQVIINAINRQLADLDNSRLERIVIVGNPVMIHLLLGADIEGLAVYPYQGVINEALSLPADKSGFMVPEETEIYLPPPAGLYVGSDALTGAASLEPTDNFLLIDLGTNAEIIAHSGDNWLAVSAAAGPAFEGASIYQGMRALPGAITGCIWSNNHLKCQWLPGSSPRGICGSGLVQSIAALRDLNVIDIDGIITDDPPVPIKIRGGTQGREVVIYEDADSIVVLTQEDVRQFQLAKAAVRVAIDTIIGQLPEAKWKKVFLAGALGNNLSTTALKQLGVLPDISDAEIIPAGNTALQGAALAAARPAFRSRLEKLAPQIKVLELANQPGFQTAFLEQLRL